MNDSEGYLQERAERPTSEATNGLHSEEQLREIALYRQLFEALGEETTFQVSPDFAVRVAANAQRRRKIFRVEWIEWLPAAAIVAIGAISFGIVEPYRALLIEAAVEVSEFLSVPAVRAAGIAAVGTFLLDRLVIRKRLPARL